MKLTREQANDRINAAIHDLRNIASEPLTPRYIANYLTPIADALDDVDMGDLTL